MKLLTILVSFFSLFAGQAFAHTDHALGEGSIHAFYHAVFSTLFALVVYKAYIWFKHKKSQKKLASFKIVITAFITAVITLTNKKRAFKVNLKALFSYR